MALFLAMALGLAIPTQTARAATARYVATTGSDSGDCSSTPCLTINYAVGQAAPGDTINVAAGTYAENVVIAKSITLLTTAGAIIQPASGPAVALRSPAALPLPLQNVTIQGFTLDGSAGILIDKNWWGGVEALSVQNLTLSGVTASGNTSSGLTIAWGAIVNDLTITDSHFDNNFQGIGISNATTQVNNLTIKNSTISNNIQLGMYILGPVITTFSIQDTTVGQNGWEGMVIDNGAHLTGLTIDNSHLDSNGRLNAGRGNGIGIAHTGTWVNGLTIQYSTLSNNRNVGMYLTQPSVTNLSLQNTTIAGNAYDGIHVTGSTVLNTATLSGGALQNNGGFGLVTKSGTGGLPTLTNFTMDGVLVSGNNNSGVGLVGNLNGINSIRNSTFQNSAWEDLDIGVGWLGSPTAVANLSVTSNIFLSGRAWTGIWVDSTTSGVGTIGIHFNSFDRDGWSVWNANGTGINAENNWWGSASGPGWVGPGTGDNVSINVDFDPWLCDGTDTDLDTPGFQPTGQTDCTAPVVSGVSVSPSPVYLNALTTVNAIADDTATGNSNIASAEYNLNDTSWLPMTATDGTFDGPNEAITATFTASTFGSNQFCVRATDVWGNLSASTCFAFTVGYKFTGFFQPIDMRTVNSAKAGQTIPVKWLLLDALGVPVSDPDSFAKLYSYYVNCESSVRTDAIEEYSSGTSGLQYLGDGYWQFNWKTPKTYAGTCRAMYIEFSGGTTSPLVNFQFK